jgi:hypothetical protein
LAGEEPSQGHWPLASAGEEDLEHDRDQTSRCVTLHPDGSLLAVYYLKPARVVLLDITDTEQGSYPIVYAAIPGPG